MNIIDCTIKMKEETRDHYGRLAESMNDTELKRIFSLLEAAEEEHIANLREIRGRINKESLGNRLDGRVCVFSPNIDLKSPAKELENDPDAYIHVMREEEGAIEFFDQLAAQANDAEVRKIYRTLARKERDHQIMVENIYAFLEAPRTYLEWVEFSNRGRL